MATSTQTRNEAASRELQLVALRSLIASGSAKRTRVASGMSLKSVADAVGTNFTTVWRWENRKSKPSSDAAIRYLDLLRTIADLLPEEGRDR